MSNISSSNKTIAKNTVFLYIRMVVTMLISLYTSRVLLQILGVDDFGTYGLVGGIVSMFASLKTMFTVAVQRFMNIEIGKGDYNELKKIFNISILVNAIIAVVFIIAVEIGGIWLLENKLHIASERMTAARWVFQFSVLSAAISIIDIPFSANIIAREKMDFMAIVSICDAVAKLSIVLLLPVFGGDKLIIYGLLMMLISCGNLLVETIYCRIKFVESRIRKYSVDEIRVKFKEMFSFSGWAFFGNVAFALVNEGLNVLLNIFGNLAANAARTISYQVKGALSTVVSNVYTAIKPQAIQSYARKDMERFYKLMFTGAKVVGYMYIMMAIPLYFTLDEILALWLGSVPEYAITFLTIIFLYQFVRVLHESVGSFFVTIGRLREYQITEVLVGGSALPLSYIGLKFCNMPIYGVFIVLTFAEVANLIAISLIAKRIGNFDVHRYVNTVVLPYFMMTTTCFAVVFLLNKTIRFIQVNDTVRAFILISIAIILEFLILFYLGLNKEERNFLINLVKRKKNE